MKGFSIELTDYALGFGCKEQNTRTQVVIHLEQGF